LKPRAIAGDPFGVQKTRPRRGLLVFWTPNGVTGNSRGFNPGPRDPRRAPAYLFLFSITNRSCFSFVRKSVGSAPPGSA
jgi:hypothetical protein